MSDITRRHLLRVGTLVVLALPDLLHAEARAATSARPRVRSVILIQHYGAPSHIDLWDPKPDAPAEIRGEFGTIPTSLPGYRVTEVMPRLARLCHKLTVLRSMTHRTANHNPGTYLAITGHTPEGDVVQVGATSGDWPAYGSVMARFKGGQDAVPPFVQLPHVAFDQVYKCPGQWGGWLGKGHDPFIAVGDPNRPDYRFELSLPAGVTTDRLENRRALPRAVERQTRGLENLASRGLDAYHDRAFSIVTSSQTRRAFDLSAEPAHLRDRYGRNQVGQSYLLSRRLVEAGVRFVTCFNGSNPGDGWDTHENNFNRLKRDLMPPDDQGFSALIEDLDVRGLLDTTLVIWAGEFGRKPEIAKAGPTFVGRAGRDHWPACYTIVMAGGGAREGFLYGASDGSARYPKEKPTAPADFAATLYQAMGIDPATEVQDILGRPMRLTHGSPVAELFR